MTVARETLNRNIPDYLKAGALASKHAPSGIHDAAYFGSGSDAETLLYVTNADHGWMFDAIQLESGEFPFQKTNLPLKETNLWKEWTSGKIEEHANGEWAGSFSPQACHEGQLGKFLLGNLKLIGATNISLEEISRYRTDIRFNWKHPDDAAEKPRTLSFVWTPMPYTDPSDRRAQMDGRNTLKEPLPQFDFAMTRGYNGPELSEVPAFNRIVNHVRPGGVLFIDRDAKKIGGISPAREQADSYDWPHGGLRVYTKKFPARRFENRAA